jgi:membrane associated rhomboid family serine protease
MFYRVDYVFAVMSAGFLIGSFTGKWTLRFEVSRLARAYFGAVLALLALSSIRLTIFLTLGHGPTWAGLINDLSGMLYGALFGIAVRRDDRRELLLDPRGALSTCDIGRGHVRQRRTGQGVCDGADA